MIYVNDCSIRVVRSFIKKFVQEMFVQVFAYENYLQRKRANYVILYVCPKQHVKHTHIHSFPVVKFCFVSFFNMIIDVYTL